MADWWEAAPLVEPKQKNWWDDAPVADQGGRPSVQKAADAYEKLRGNSTFTDATDAGIGGIPFADEMYSALAALPNAAISAAKGDGFHPVDEYNHSQALLAELKNRREKRSPVASIAGEVASGMGVGGVAAKGGLTLLNNAKPTLASLVGRGAGEGAIYGALYGAGEGEGLEDRAVSALKGAGVGGTVGGVTGAIGRIGAGKIADDATPSLEQLREAGELAYKAADQAGVVFTPAAMDKLKTDLTSQFADFGYLPSQQPGAAAALSEIDRVAQGNVTLKGLDAIRKAANNAYIPGNKPNNALLRKIIDGIDGLVASPTADDILMGDPQAGKMALDEARGLWSRASKTERVEKAIEKAELRAASTGSGGNVDNAVRQNLRRIVENPRGFSDDEVAALTKVVRGTKTQNALRLAGKLSPSGNGLMAALGIGGTMINPAVGVASLGGMAAKSLADGMTTKNSAVARALIRSGGKLPQAEIGAGRKALIDALMRTGAQQLPGYINP